MMQSNQAVQLLASTDPPGLCDGAADLQTPTQEVPPRNIPISYIRRKLNPAVPLVKVDWRMMKDGDGMKLWRAAVPTTVWCMIRTRAAVPAPPLEVLTYLLDDSCISEYDELFDKIEVIEPIDDSSTFKRT